MKQSKYGTWEDPVLIWIAERSPKSFALQIRRRNKKLLQVLPDLVKGARILRSEATHLGNYGCPHCKPDERKAGAAICTSACLWRRAYVELERDVRPFVCINHIFAGYTYRELEANDRDINACLEYGANCERIIVSPGATLQGVQPISKFLEAHIEWSKYPHWGRYAKTKKTN